MTLQTSQFASYHVCLQSTSSVLPPHSRLVELQISPSCILVSVMDHHLYTAKGPPPNTVFWRPQEGGSVVLRESDYQPFSHIVRTVHLPDALTICAENRITPKPILCRSILNAKALYWKGYHPCRNLQVLWFGAKSVREDEDAHDWYGNVEFSVSTDVLMQRWKNFYLVELMTTHTQTMTRILVTNADYSSVLPRYDPRTQGGSWRLTPDGRHERLVDCRRFNNNGYNGHGHALEFMIEVTQYGMQKILDEAEISFKNHHRGRSGGPHDCHRFGRPPRCPTPFTKDVTSMVFFKEHHRLIAHQPMATPRLSPSAEAFRQRFLAAEEIPRNALQVPPPLSDHHFPPLPPPGQGGVIFSRILQQSLQNGTVRQCQLTFGFEQDSVFRILAESIRNPNMEEEEDEEEIVNLHQYRHPRMLPPSMPFAAPPGFPPLPLPLGPPPLNLPPPPVYHPAMFQHSWAPLQPISLRRQN